MAECLKLSRLSFVANDVKVRQSLFERCELAEMLFNLRFTYFCIVQVYV